MHTYVLYGLGIHSEVPLWGAEVEDCPDDVKIWWRVRKDPLPDSQPGRQTSRLGPAGEIEFSWPGIASMSIRGGCEIQIETGDQEELNHARHLIAGLGMGFILHQRGLLTLHASAVAIGGKAIGIAGAKRAGKSTTAAALAARGHTLLSDDILALDMSGDGAPRVFTGPSTINLWPDSAEALGQDPGDLPKIWPRSTKRVALLSADDMPRTPTLRCVFFLERADKEMPGTERLDPCETMGLLIGHSYALRVVEDTASMPKHLIQCGRVANTVEMYRLKRPQSLKSIDDVVALIEERVQSLPSREERLAEVPVP